MRFLGTRVSKIPDKALSPLWRTSSCQVEPQNCAMGTKGCAGDPASAGSRPSGADVAEGLCQVPQVTKQGTIMNIKEPYILVSPLKCQVSGHAELIPAHPSSFFDLFLLFERLTGYFSWWRIWISRVQGESFYLRGNGYSLRFLSGTLGRTMETTTRLLIPVISASDNFRFPIRRQKRSAHGPTSTLVDFCQISARSFLTPPSSRKTGSGNPSISVLQRRDAAWRPSAPVISSASPPEISAARCQSSSRRLVCGWFGSCGRSCWRCRWVERACPPKAHDVPSKLIHFCWIWWFNSGSFMFNMRSFCWNINAGTPGINLKMFRSNETSDLETPCRAPSISQYSTFPYISTVQIEQLVTKYTSTWEVNFDSGHSYLAGFSMVINQARILAKPRIGFHLEVSGKSRSWWNFMQAQGDLPTIQA